MEFDDLTDTELRQLIEDQKPKIRDNDHEAFRLFNRAQAEERQRREASRLNLEMNPLDDFGRDSLGGH